MTKRRLVIATRESKLAMWQAEWVKGQLSKLHPNLSIELLGMTTSGDQQQDVALRKIGGKGLFIKELEEALLDGRADIAVHSMKDVPMDLPPGFALPVICERDDPRDVFVSNKYKSIAELPTSATIGTASLRRQTQLQALRSDLNMQDIRGNIHTRLRKLDDGEYDGLIMASAGLRRMELGNRISAYLSVEECLPAAGQGALGIECLEGADAVKELIMPLNHELTAIAVTAERAVCRRLNGGCQVPIAAFAEVHRDDVHLRALVAGRNGVHIVRSELTGKSEHADSIGTRVADELIQQGAEKILREFHD